MRTRSGRTLWSVPYPQDLNAIPMIVDRQMDAKDFAQIIMDQFDEMLDMQVIGDMARAAPCATPLLNACASIYTAASGPCSQAPQRGIRRTALPRSTACRSAGANPNARRPFT